jgi:outer membrane receptor protein involved in Fe transport
MPGQLATANDETQSAARSAALALQLFEQHRSTRELTAVQLSDARDEIVKAYEGIATQKAEDPADLDRQSLLTRSMTELIGTLNNANAAVRGLPGQSDLRTLGQNLLDGVNALEQSYR